MSYCVFGSIERLLWSDTLPFEGYTERQISMILWTYFLPKKNTANTARGPVPNSHLGVGPPTEVARKETPKADSRAGERAARSEIEPLR